MSVSSYPVSVFLNFYFSAWAMASFFPIYRDLSSDGFVIVYTGLSDSTFVDALQSLADVILRGHLHIPPFSVVSVVPLRFRHDRVPLLIHSFSHCTHSICHYSHIECTAVVWYVCYLSPGVFSTSRRDWIIILSLTTLLSLRGSTRSFASSLVYCA